MEKKRVILDCDPGVGIIGIDADDPLAILLALGSKELLIEGITTVYGNVEVNLATRSALKVLEVIGRSDIPVAKGMSLPLSGFHHPEIERQYNGNRGKVGLISLPEIKDKILNIHAVDFIISKVLENPNELSIITIGPQTNVACAIIKEPSIRNKVKEIIMMGGALGLDPNFGKGNITPVAELNIWHDPQAANIVFSSGIPITMVSLDVTNPAKGTVLYKETLKEIEIKKTRVTDFIYDICKTYIDKPMFNWIKKAGCILYDPLAVAVAALPSLAKTVKMCVQVETKGEYTFGQTIADIRKVDGKNENIDVCIDVESDNFIRMFVERLCSL
ncbi:nucleoside hydrolase [Atribacter laminatus]|uniref:Pyrimidine-specific ribonucleoside hydrolase RihA n=1 Tax=Atribacter laminatus TaxID=2847778 RepID=A0A7T1AL14_ATRLM|nr:nucleoside hydrolase [Atribacter laminatus]QPM67873.1 Pyrimidine-specific ribonucleoside hydrolase RihA [Atribacter laminatus]